MSDQEPEVFAALAQRRGAYHSDRETIIQILAQLSLAHGLLGFAVGRGDDAHVNRNLARSTDRTNASLLDGAQQLGLRLRTHFGYFVEKQSSALRRTKQAELLLVGAAEGAPHITEKFTFDKILGQRGAIERDERQMRCRGLMNCARDQLLAGSAFSDN